jgi:kumamolisin
MAATRPGYRQLDNSLRPPLRGARPVGPIDPDVTVLFTIVMRRRPDAPVLPGHDYWMSVPPGRRTFLSRADYAAKYGAAPDELDLVVRFCRDRSLTVAESSIARRSVSASATAEVVAEVFGVELKRYATPHETYRGHEGYVQLPADIADVVEGVLGFDNRRLGARASNGGPAGAMPLSPIEVANSYQFPLSGSGRWKDATGQTIGIPEFGGSYDATDFQSYFASLSIATPPQVISIPPSVPLVGTPQSPDTDSIEVALDVEVAGAIAQGAKIVLYFGTGTTANHRPDEKGWHDLLSSAVHDSTNNPSVLSISWSAPEANWAPGAIDLISPIFHDAANVGITVLASSGDFGASGYHSGQGNGNPNVHYPASDPWVTGCGGTVLLAPAPYFQLTWNDQSGATGGGVSGHFANPPPWLPNVPAWQIGGTPLSGRGVPDVAGNASGYSGYDLFIYGKKTSDLNSLFGSTSATHAGTSAVAPLYAGLIALINANLATRVGFLNPTLYQLAPGYPNIVFQDVAVGNNDFDGISAYQSATGWDPCTGWGSINGIQLLETILLGYVASNPGCVASIQRLAQAVTGR